MSKRQYLIEQIDHLIKNKATSEMVIDRLIDEGVLHIGYGNADVDKILEAFSRTFGTTKASKYDRFSASRLATKYGAQAVIGIVTLLGQGEDKFKPVVNSVSQLEEKMPSVLNYLRNIKGEETIDA